MAAKEDGRVTFLSRALEQGTKKNEVAYTESQQCPEVYGLRRVSDVFVACSMDSLFFPIWLQFSTKTYSYALAELYLDLLHCNTMPRRGISFSLQQYQDHDQTWYGRSE